MSVSPSIDSAFEEAEKRALDRYDEAKKAAEAATKHAEEMGYRARIIGRYKKDAQRLFRMSDSQLSVMDPRLLYPWKGFIHNGAVNFPEDPVGNMLLCLSGGLPPCGFSYEKKGGISYEGAKNAISRLLYSIESRAMNEKTYTSLQDGSHELLQRLKAQGIINVDEVRTTPKIERKEPYKPRYSRY